ncbi:MAG TPA: M1 family aminopeptidase [Candidatus Limnocylindria bacterium]|nr:M1 family aminopeptidase [Candidatus Limnocylindria bacterium]
MTIAATSVTSPAAALSTVSVIQRYEIVATLDVASGRLDAVETLTLTNRAWYPIDRVNLSVIPRALGYFTLDGGVTVDGEPADAAWTTGTNLRIELGRRLRTDETVAIRVPFMLTVGASPDAFTARLSRDNGVISFGHWFPIVSREHDVYGLGDPQISYTAELIRLDLTTTGALPRDAVACPGLLTAPRATGTRWVCEAEDVRDFSFVVNPRFRLTTRSVGDTTVRVYTETVDGSLTADLAQAALVRLGEAFGAYPWPDLVLAEVGAGGGFSMEYPRAIHLTRTKVTDPYVVNHEVGHQWFYAQLGNHQMREPWLDEGLADFSARLVMGIGEEQCSPRDVDSPVFAWPADATTGGDWTSCDGYFHTVFYKGTEFLNEIRAAMGDDAFFAAMRDFVAEHRFGVVTGRQLLAHLRDRSETDLLPIYRRYLETYDAPVALAKERGLRSDASGHSLTLTANTR